MKKVDANTYLEVKCNCPYCNAFLDIFDKDIVREAISDDLRSEGCDIEITCEECEKEFIVENIYY